MERTRETGSASQLLRELGIMPTARLASIVLGFKKTWEAWERERCAKIAEDALDPTEGARIAASIREDVIYIDKLGRYVRKADAYSDKDLI